MKSRLDVRMTKKEKAIIIGLANKHGMTMTEYIKYMIFDQNTDLITNKYIYHCPGGDRFNYSLLGITQQTQELIKPVLEHLYGEKTKKIIDESFTHTKEKLEKQYGYKKFKEDSNE